MCAASFHAAIVKPQSQIIFFNFYLSLAVSELHIKFLLIVACKLLRDTIKILSLFTLLS